MGYQDVNTSLSGSGRRCPLVIFYPLFSGTQQAGGISIGTVNGGIFNLELDYGTNDSIVLVPNSSSSSYNFLPGSVCRIYGEKWTEKRSTPAPKRERGCFTLAHGMIT